MQGGRLQIVDGIDGRVSRHEHPHDIEMALLACPMQRSIVVTITLVHISVIVYILKQRIQITLRIAVKGQAAKESRRSLVVGSETSNGNKFKAFNFDTLKV